MSYNSTRHSLPHPSALTTLIDSASAKNPSNALPLEVLHNLRFQHNWTELEIHPTQPSRTENTTLDTLRHNEPIDSLTHPQSPSPELLHPPPVPLLSGIPPRPIYTHPDFQAHLLAHNLTENDVPPWREWVLPMNVGEKWTLERFCGVFDGLPKRAPLHGSGGHTQQDAKRVLLAMVSRPGKGGDGTIVYYIMQEGDVKPRQN